MSVRRGRISEAGRGRALAHLLSLDIEIDPHTIRHAWSETLALSTRFALTIYDAAYLELAHRRGLPLASLDRELRAAGEELGVPLLGA